MARNIEDLNLDEITEELLLDEAIDIGDELEVDTRQGSIYRDAADGHVIRTAKFFNDLRQVSEIISLDSCTGEVLDERLRERGLQRNPPESTQAIYYVEYVGAKPEIGDVVTCEGYFFTVDVLDGKDVIISEEYGSEMNNLLPGSPVIPELDVDGLESATLKELAVPALDVESDDSARTRLINRISGPDENANISQVKTWCESVEGVGRARIIPLWDGPMSVKGVIISRDGGVPTSKVVEDVQKYIDPGSEGMGEGVAPIGQKFTAAAAEGVKINVSVTIIKRAEASGQTIKEELEKQLKEYYKTIALAEYTQEIQVRYTRISAIITEMEDVIDHENLLVNGSEDNVEFTVSQIPVFGEVVINGDIL